MAPCPHASETDLMHHVADPEHVVIINLATASNHRDVLHHLFTITHTNGWHPLLYQRPNHTLVDALTSTVAVATLVVLLR